MVSKVNVMARAVNKLAAVPVIEATARAHSALEKIMELLPDDDPAQPMLKSMMTGIHMLGANLVGRAIEGGGSEDE